MICMGVFGIYAALASKMHRANKVFNQSNRFQRVQVRVIDGIGPSLIFLALDLVLLITWTASSPLEFEYTDNSSACFSPDALEYSVVLALLNLGLICYALAEAWRARKVANLYSESSSMFVSMFHVLLAAIIAIPIILLTFSGDRDSESSINFDDSKFVVAIRLFAYAALVLVCCCSNLILVFAPKMRSYRTLENEKDVERAEILHKRGMGKADDGEYRGALEDFEEALEIRQTALGRRNEATIETTKAITELIDHIRTESGGMGVLSTVPSLTKIINGAGEKGIRAKKSRKTAETSTMMSTAFLNCMSLAPGNSVDSITSNDHVGDSSLSRRRLNRAMSVVTKHNRTDLALRKARADPNVSQSHLAQCLLDHASAFEKAGNVITAYGLAIEAQNILKAIAEEDEAAVLDVATCCVLLGRICYQMEDYDEGYTYHERALKIRMKTSGLYTELVLESLAYTAEALLAKGNCVERATSLAFHAMEYSKLKQNAVENMSYARAQGTLARAYLLNGRLIEARKLFEECLDIYRLDEYRDYSSGSMLLEYGNVLSQCGDHVEAKAVFGQAVQMCNESEQHLCKERLSQIPEKGTWRHCFGLKHRHAARFPNVKGPSVKEPLIILTDIARDIDDELALSLIAPLRKQGFLSPVAIITTLRPTKDRALLARGFLDSFGLIDIPIGIGGDGGANNDADFNGSTYEASSSLDLSNGGVGIRLDGMQLMIDVLKAASQKSVRLLCIASLSDAAELITRNESLFADRMKEVVIMGGATIKFSEIQPDTAYNNTCDMKSAQLVYKKCKELGVSTLTITRHSAYSCSFSNTLLDDLRDTGHVASAKIRNNALSALNKLWIKINLPPGDRRREKLPARCDRHWFLTTFFSDEEAANNLREDGDNTSIWAQKVMFHMYDPLALLCCIPTFRNKYFNVKNYNINGVSHGICGLSNTDNGVVDGDALSQEIRLLLTKALKDCLLRSEK